MNKLLERQIGKYIGKRAIDEDFSKLLSVISESYDHYDKDRKMLERSIEISSKELIELNNNLRSEIEVSNRSVYESLKESLSSLEGAEFSQSGFDPKEIIHLAELLKSESQKRKIAERENSQHRTHLEASQRIAKVGSWEIHKPISDIYSEHSKSMYLSEETYNVLGIDNGTHIDGEMFFGMVHPEDKEFVVKMMNEAAKTLSFYDIEHRIETPGGLNKIVHSRAEISRDERRGLLVIRGTIQDITDRKNKDKQLQKVNDELRSLFQNMQEVFYSVNMQTFQVMQMSPACEKVYGYKAEAFFNNSNLWFEVVLDEDKPIIYFNQPALERGETIFQTYRIQHSDGTVKWVESRIQPTLNEKGELIRIDGLTADITKSKEDEIAIRNSESKFRFLIENSIDAIMVLNNALEVSYASDSLYRIMGYTEDEIIGKRTIEHIYPDDHSLLITHTEQVLNNPGKTFTIIYRRVKKDGTYIWCEGSATNLLHEKAINGIVVNFRDITERKAANDALTQSNEELKKTNSELDKFVYSVSHDLKAPLSSMLGVIELSETETVDELMIKHLGMLKKSVNRLDGFINDILDYSRNSRKDLKKEIINFRELTAEVVSNLKFMDAGNNSIEVKFDFDHDFTFISDWGRICIILNNLISNAFRYSNPKQSASFVRISAENLPDGVRLIVEDNGLGIDADKHDRIFEMFYRVSQKSLGSGLGLYIVKETVEKLNGEIQLQSSLEIGSIFTITLPNL